LGRDFKLGKRDTETLKAKIIYKIETKKIKENHKKKSESVNPIFKFPILHAIGEVRGNWRVNGLE